MCTLEGLMVRSMHMHSRRATQKIQHGAGDDKHEPWGFRRLMHTMFTFFLGLHGGDTCVQDAEIIRVCHNKQSCVALFCLCMS